jgi:Flp pilus assembly pilin Flp
MKRAGLRSRRRKGQALVEYALILAFMAALCIAIFTPWGAPLRGLYVYIIEAIAHAAASIA